MNDLDTKLAFAKGFAIGQLIKLETEIQGLIDFEESCCGNTTLGYQCLSAIKDKISELEGENE